MGIFDQTIGQSGSSATQQTADNATRLPEFQLDKVRTGFDAATNEFAQGPRQFFPGSTVAGFTPNQTQGFQQLLQGASAGQGQVDQAGQVVQQNFARALSGQQNPFLQQAISAAINPIQERLQEQILPQISQTALAGGGFGGSRQTFAGEVPALRDFSRTANEVAGALAFQDFTNTQNRALQSVGAIPTLQSANLLPGQVQTQVGEAERALNQARIGEDVERFNFGQAAEAANIAELLGLLNFNVGQDQSTQAGSNTQTSGSSTSSDGGSFIDAGAGLVGIGKGLFDLFS